MTHGGAHVFADGHGHAENKMMAPLGNHHLHFCGIHCAKKDPRIQIITQHYCGMVGEGMHQCLLYDSVGTNARLLGVEYIIFERLCRSISRQLTPTRRCGCDARSDHSGAQM